MFTHFVITSLKQKCGNIKINVMQNKLQSIIFPHALLSRFKALAAAGISFVLVVITGFSESMIVKLQGFAADYVNIEPEECSIPSHTPPPPPPPPPQKKKKKKKNLQHIHTPIFQKKILTAY